MNDLRSAATLWAGVVTEGSLLPCVTDLFAERDDPRSVLATVLAGSRAYDPAVLGVTVVDERVSGDEVPDSDGRAIRLLDVETEDEGVIRVAVFFGVRPRRARIDRVANDATLANVCRSWTRIYGKDTPKLIEEVANE